MCAIERHIAPILEKRFKNNIVLSLTGARQVGKSALCNHLFYGLERVNLDSVTIRAIVDDDEMGFLNKKDVPLFIDEVQKCPDIFETIKEKIDNESLPYGSYLLASSQKLELRKGEKILAGRVSTNELLGLSLREINEVPFYEHFIPTDAYLAKREEHLYSYGDVWDVIHRGQYPELYENEKKDWEDFYSSYVDTYIEKDVAGLISTGNILKFTKFMTSLASRTGNVLSCANIAREVGVSEKTIGEWINILVRSDIVCLLKPYFSSHLSRAIKAPKIYFKDTGLACYLTRWLTKETAQNGNMAGSLFETFVVNEIIKTFTNAGEKYDFSIFYYRGKDKKRKKIKLNGETYEEMVEGEIDLIIQEGDVLYPIEIKETSNPDIKMASEFSVLDQEVDKRRGRGVIICTYPEKLYLKDDVLCLPLEYI